MLRRLVLIPLFACACFAGAQQGLDQNPTINYSTPAVPAYKAVDDIARLAEKRLKVLPPLDKEPLVLRIHDYPYLDTLNLIAKVLHGSWSDEGVYKILKRDAYNQMTVANRSHRARMNAVIDEIEKTAGAKVFPPLTKQQATADIQALSSGGEAAASAAEDSADARLLNVAFRGVTITSLLRARTPEHIVLSTEPKLLQEKLRISPDVLNTLVADENLWSQVQHQLSKTRGKSGGQPSPITGHIRVLLILGDMKDGLPTMATAEMVNDNGQVLVRAQQPMSIADPIVAEASNFSVPVSGAVPVSPDTAAFWSSLGSSSVEIPGTLRNALMNSDINDPLNLGVADTLLKIGDKASWNIVASTPDETVFDAAFAHLADNGSVTADGFLKTLAHTCEIDFKDGALTVSPINAVEALSKRSDRKALADLVDTVVRTGYAPVYEQVEFVSARGASADPGLVRSYLHALNVPVDPFAGSSLSALAFYGALTDEERKRLLGAFNLSFKDLDANQQTLLRAMIFDPSMRFVFGSSPADLRIDPTYPEVTEIMQDTLTPDEQVGLATRAEKAVRIRGIDANGDAVDAVMTMDDARARVSGGWQSVEVDTADADVLKLTVYPTDGLAFAYFMREYPKGWTRVDDYKKLLGSEPSKQTAKSGKSSETPTTTKKKGKQA